MQALRTTSAESGDPKTFNLGVYVLSKCERRELAPVHSTKDVGFMSRVFLGDLLRGWAACQRDTDYQGCRNVPLLADASCSLHPQSLTDANRQEGRP